jgi:hypothetical protein
MNEKAELDNTDETDVIDETEQPEAQAEGEQVQNDEEEEVVVSIGEEAPPPEEQTHAPEWVRELRKTNRELKRQNQELQGRLQQTAPVQQVIQLGKKPTLEDHDYDAEKFEQSLESWYDRKRQIDEQQARQEAEVQNQNRAWQAKLDSYTKAKSELRVKDFEDAEAVAQELFSVVQQGVIVQGANNSALLIYAIGKNPKKAKELADIKDPVKFAFAVANLERELKVTNRRAAPAPERIVTGTGRSSGAVDSTLERLREEAARTGNMSKVVAYKRQKKA